MTLTAEQITEQIAKLMKDHQSIVGKNRQIEIQIDQLQKALHYANYAYDEASQIQRDVAKLEKPAGWKGKTAKRYGSGDYPALERYAREYRQSISDLRDNINRKILELQSQQNHFVAIANSALETIADLKSMLASL